MPEKQTIRCAIYTRKSTEEGLDQDFNSLDAQREAAEAYIASQKGEGWVCLPDRYDDGGFSGGNMDRPALARLMADVEAGNVDCIVVYKVDRLSRSLLDFARMMETLEKHTVSFVSVTQHFNTTDSMGRLTLNVFLSFAQFEREIIAERTRDKMIAARRRGKWTGGPPALGYDVHPDGGRIVVNEQEAAQVRSIFTLYLEKGSLRRAAQELKQRGWHNKRWVNRQGGVCGGRPFVHPSLYRLLTNPIYIGKVRCLGTAYEGEHEAIVDERIWRRVGARMMHNGRAGGRDVRNKYGALLKGLLYCGSCGVPMMHSYTQKKSGRRYRYYVCSKAQTDGWNACPTKSVSAPEIERFVTERIRCIGKDPGVLEATLAQVQGKSRQQVEWLRKERRTVRAQLRRCQKEVEGIVGLTAMNGNGTAPATARLAELQEQICAKEKRATTIGEELLALRDKTLADKGVAAALGEFDTVWETLSPREQTRIVRLLVERVEYDGERGTIAVTFRQGGIRTLTGESEPDRKDKRA